MKTKHPVLSIASLAYRRFGTLFGRRKGTPSAERIVSAADATFGAKQESVLARLCWGYGFDETVRARAIVALSEAPAASVEEIGFQVARELWAELQACRALEQRMQALAAATATEHKAAIAERAAADELLQAVKRAAEEQKSVRDLCADLAAQAEAAKAEALQLRAENERLRSAPNPRTTKTDAEIRKLRAELQFSRKACQAYRRLAEAPENKISHDHTK